MKQLQKEMRMIKDMEIIQNCEPIRSKKIVLYGGGDYGKMAADLLRRLGIPIGAICTTTKEENPLIKDVPYIGPGGLKNMDDKEDLLIVMATIKNEFVEQMIDTLNQHRIFRGRRITYLALHYACRLNREMDKDGILDLECELWQRALDYSRRGLQYQAWWWGLSTNAVWVYTPGKVGSSTLSKSLAKCRISNAHIHIMQKEGLRKGILRYLDGRETFLDRPFEGYDALLERLKEQRNVRIITAVREPIARDISSFFQGFRTPPYSYWLDLTNDLYHDFLRMTKNVMGSGNVWNMFDWFDQELKSVFGIDVYDHPFDRERGYAIIESGNISVLVLKLEKLNELASVIGDFVHTNDFELVKANETKEAPQRYLYEEFKQNVKLPQSYVDSYYKDNSRMDHFYSQEEQAAFLQKWSRNIVKD